jgi:hypothetical protein
VLLTPQLMIVVIFRLKEPLSSEDETIIAKRYLSGYNVALPLNNNSVSINVGLRLPSLPSL